MAAPYNINRKCCATCRFWDGDRRPETRANRLFQVICSGKAAPCMVKPNSACLTPVNYCPRWQKAPQLA